MKALFDSTILVAGLWADHARHEQANRWLADAKKGEVEAYTSQHALAEAFSVLTNAPVLPRFHPHNVRTVLGETLWNVGLVPLDEADYLQALEHAAGFDIAGDAFSLLLHYRAAVKIEADLLVTLEKSDYRWMAGLPGRPIEIRSL